MQTLASNEQSRSDTSPVIMWIDASTSVTYLLVERYLVIKKILTDLVVMALGI